MLCSLSFSCREKGRAVGLHCASGDLQLRQCFFLDSKFSQIASFKSFSQQLSLTPFPCSRSVLFAGVTTVPRARAALQESRVFLWSLEIGGRDGEGSLSRSGRQEVTGEVMCGWGEMQRLFKMAGVSKGKRRAGAKHRVCRGSLQWELVGTNGN